jgi:hypothetical protein
MHTDKNGSYPCASVSICGSVFSFPSKLGTGRARDLPMSKRLTIENVNLDDSDQKAFSMERDAYEGSPGRRNAGRLGARVRLLASASLGLFEPSSG